MAAVSCGLIDRSFRSRLAAPKVTVSAEPREEQRAPLVGAAGAERLTCVGAT